MTIVLASDADPVRARLERRGADALVVDGGAAGNAHVATFVVDLAIRLLPAQTLQRNRSMAATGISFDGLHQEARYDAMVTSIGGWIQVDTGKNAPRPGARNRRRNARGLM